MIGPTPVNTDAIETAFPLFFLKYELIATVIDDIVKLIPKAVGIII